MGVDAGIFWTHARRVARASLAHASPTCASPTHASQRCVLGACISIFASSLCARLSSENESTAASTTSPLFSHDIPPPTFRRSLGAPMAYKYGSIASSQGVGFPELRWLGITQISLLQF